MSERTVAVDIPFELFVRLSEMAAFFGVPVPELVADAIEVDLLALEAGKVRGRGPDRLPS